MSGLFNLTTAPEVKKRLVWNKGRVIPGQDPNEWRWDDFGHVIRFSKYGDSNSTHGWEIDHIDPTCLGGRDDLSNLRPLRCAVNATLGGILGAALQPR
jgi:hypothetical protein